LQTKKTKRQTHHFITLFKMSSSWIPYSENVDFPLENIPFGISARKSEGSTARHFACTAIGDFVVDLSVLAANGIFAGGAGGDATTSALQKPLLNDFMSLGRPVWRSVRSRIQSLLRLNGDSTLSENTELRSSCLIPSSDVEMKLPARIGDYTDFYSSRDHAYNVGVMIRGPANALQPNWSWLPVGYHGRSSSVVVSGTNFKRPCGQLQADPSDATKGAVFGPTKRLDFELEVGAWIGAGNALGDPIAVGDADEHIFGLCLMNDWSARDIQTWEYVPLGPFCAKNFCTSVSPWIVTLDALESFKCPTSSGVQDPAPLPYLVDKEYGSYDIKLEVAIRPSGCPEDEEASVVTRSNYRHMYWNLRQQLAHHTSSGCNMNPGDLFGSGTVSGPTEGERGCLLELTWKGEKPLQLARGETRTFLKDGDEVIMKGWCEKGGEGGGRIGFGECKGVVLRGNM